MVTSSSRPVDDSDEEFGETTYRRRPSVKTSRGGGNGNGVVSESLSSSSSSPPREGSLGPVTERFVVAKRGMDLILECRDADSDSWVYWTKHGGRVYIPFRPL